MKQPAQDTPQNRSLPEVSEPSVPTLQTGQPTLKKTVSWTMIFLWAGAALVGILAETLFRSAFWFPFTFYGRDIIDANIIITFAVPFLIQGLIIGFLQWIILKRYLDISAIWILLTVIGLVVGKGIPWYFFLSFNLILFTYMVNLGILGAAQFIELRKHLARGRLWVIIMISSAAIPVLIMDNSGFTVWYFLNNHPTDWLDKGINLTFHLLSGIGLYALLRKNVNV